MNEAATSSDERLYMKALNIREGRARGYWLPKMWHLALRGHSGAMIDLADWLSDGCGTGSPADNFSAAGLYRRAFCQGDSRAAHNMAMTCFNRNDLAGYRAWITKAGRSGDQAARLQASRFETRLPHSAAAKVRRIRPDQKRDEFA